MITSVIFDLGNVLLNWNPAGYLKDNGYTEPLKSQVLNDIFHSPEWLLIDNGDITVDEAIKNISGKSVLTEGQIRAAFELRLKILSPLRRNINLLPELKKRGYRLYYLSNFPDDIFDEVRDRYDFFRYFDGGEISARMRVSKPDERIFRMFLSKYGLAPEECLFIDDSALNTGSATNAGLTSIHLHSPELLLEEIENVTGIELGIS